MAPAEGAKGIAREFTQVVYFNHFKEGRMFEQALASVFANAAVPQKIVLVALVGAIPATVVAAFLVHREKRADTTGARAIAELRLAGPALGLLVGAMNSFHMAQSILRAPIAPTTKQLAPGIFEVATLIGLGALVGIVAMIAHGALGLAAARSRS